MKEQKRFELVELVGDGVCVSSTDGEKVYAKITEAIESDCSVLLSFRGVEDLTTVFLNAAIGQLYAKYTEEEVRARLSVTDATAQDLETLKHSIERAKEYFRDAGRFISSANEILGKDEDHDQ